jgi:hypothetical protein
MVKAIWWCGLWMTLIGHKNVKNWCNTVKKAVGDKWSTAVVIEMSEMLAQLISILLFGERSNTNIITSFCHRYCPLAGNFFTTEKIRIDLVNGQRPTHSSRPTYERLGLASKRETNGRWGSGCGQETDRGNAARHPQVLHPLKNWIQQAG